MSVVWRTLPTRPQEILWSLSWKTQGFSRTGSGTEVALYWNMKMQLQMGFVCVRCGEYFTTDLVAERRISVQLFGCTDQVCPQCFSTPADREGRDLPPEKGDEI